MQVLLLRVQKAIRALLRDAGWNGDDHYMADAVKKAHHKLIRRLIALCYGSDFV